jgi:hypothetical protein
MVCTGPKYAPCTGVTHLDAANDWAAPFLGNGRLCRYYESPKGYPLPTSSST